MTSPTVTLWEVATDAARELLYRFLAAALRPPAETVARAEPADRTLKAAATAATAATAARAEMAGPGARVATPLAGPYPFSSTIAPC